MPMPEDTPPDVTLQTLHGDLGALQDWPGEMLRLLRESNRLAESRFAQLDVTLREQTSAIARVFGEGQGQIVAELRTLIARIDALIRGRRDGRSD